MLFLSLVGCCYGWWLRQPRIALGITFQTAATGLILLAISRRHGSTTLKFSFYIGLRKPERFSCTICESGVRTAISKLTMDDPWSRFTGFTDSDDMILLWRMPQYIPLPKEFSAGEDEWQRLRDFLYTRLPNRQP